MFAHISHVFLAVLSRCYYFLKNMLDFINMFLLFKNVLKEENILFVMRNSRV